MSGEPLLDHEEHRRWETAATEARGSAAVQAQAGFHQWACFMAEQASQLWVKALLHGIGDGAWGHDLVALGRRVEEATSSALPAEVAAALRRLSRFYIPTRYPDAHPGGSPGEHFGPDDAASALVDADALAAFTSGVWRSLGGTV